MLVPHLQNIGHRKWSQMCVASMVTWTHIPTMKDGDSKSQDRKSRELKNNFLCWETIQVVPYGFKRWDRPVSGRFRDRFYFIVRYRCPNSEACLIYRKGCLGSRELQQGGKLRSPAYQANKSLFLFFIYFNFRSSWNLHVQNLLPIICIHCWHKIVHITAASFILSCFRSSSPSHISFFTESI